MNEPHKSSDDIDVPEAELAVEGGMLQGRCRGALLGVAVGDALGAAFEGHPGPVPLNRLRAHLADMAPVTFTDDTAMTIAVTESLLHSDGLDEDHLAATFAAHHERRPDRGYGAGTAALLREFSRGGSWRSLAPAQFGGTGSFGNGAAMRAAPFGLWATDPSEAAALARQGAKVTHTHPHAVDAAGVQAAAVAAALSAADEQVPVGEFLRRVRQAAETAEMHEMLDTAADLHAAPGAVVARTIGTSVAALEAVPAAICAFLHHPDSFADAVTFATELGGDTDTIASMTAAIAGARLGVQAIPIPWVQRSEGVSQMRELADRLFARRHGR